MQLENVLPNATEVICEPSKAMHDAHDISFFLLLLYYLAMLFQVNGFEQQNNPMKERKY